MSLPNFNDALKMLADPYCSLILRKVELHVILHSKYIGNKEQGITEFLEWKLGVYNTQFVLAAALVSLPSVVVFTVQASI